MEKAYYISRHRGTTVEEMAQVFHYHTKAIDKLKRYVTASDLIKIKSSYHSDNISLNSSDIQLAKDIFIFHTLLNLDPNAGVGAYSEGYPGSRAIEFAYKSKLVWEDAIINMGKLVISHIRDVVPIEYGLDKAYEEKLKARIERKMKALKWRKNHEMLLKDWAFHMFKDLLLVDY